MKLFLEAVALYKDLLGPSKCETLPGKLNYTMVLDSTNAAYMVSICLHRIKRGGVGVKETEPKFQVIRRERFSRDAALIALAMFERSWSQLSR